MKKAFVWDPVMRSSALKYDPCIVSRPGEKSKCEIECSDCTLSLISDRFLGKEFSESILGNKGVEKGRYPLVIIADTLGCNLNCWFCYAYKFMSLAEASKNRCKVSYITPERLAELFYCKLKKISNLQEMLEKIEYKNFLSKEDKSKAKKHLEQKVPLWRIRISGGEPLYSNSENFIQEQDHENSIDFWTTFFKELDSKIGQIKEEGTIPIVNEEDFKQNPEKFRDTFPLAIAKKDERLNVRFDTNGMLFAKKSFTKSFVEEIYKLHKEGMLNNIYIEIDYSIKGPTPIEFYWSQGKKLPVDFEKISFDYKFDEHPQLPGYFNLVEELNKFYTEDRDFEKCIGITVERGINHDQSHRVFVNLERSLDWEKFSEKTGIKLSVVDNPIDIFNWRNQKIKKYLIKRGANVRAYRKTAGGIDLTTGSFRLEISNLKYTKDKDVYYVIFPDNNITNEKQTLWEASRDRFTEGNAWVFSGNRENLITATELKVWGLREVHKGLFEELREGDLVVFYCTRPISRFVGCGVVESKYIDDSLIWKDEKDQGTSIYPLKIKIKNMRMLPHEKWIHGLRSNKLPFYSGINLANDLHEFNNIFYKLLRLSNS